MEASTNTFTPELVMTSLVYELFVVTPVCLSLVGQGGHFWTLIMTLPLGRL